MKSLDQVGITFINGVLGRGVFNGVVNLQLGAAPFDITDDKTISEDMVPVCRLRMDIPCARALHEQLGLLLTDIDKTTTEPAGVAPPKAAEAPAPEKMN